MYSNDHVLALSTGVHHAKLRIDAIQQKISLIFNHLFFKICKKISETWSQSHRVRNFISDPQIARWILASNSVKTDRLKCIYAIYFFKKKENVKIKETFHIFLWLLDFFICAFFIQHQMFKFPSWNCWNERRKKNLYCIYNYHDENGSLEKPSMVLNNKITH